MLCGVYDFRKSFYDHDEEIIFEDIPFLDIFGVREEPQSDLA